MLNRVMLLALFSCWLEGRDFSLLEFSHDQSEGMTFVRRDYERLRRYGYVEAEGIGQGRISAKGIYFLRSEKYLSQQQKALFDKYAGRLAPFVSDSKKIDLIASNVKLPSVVVRNVLQYLRDPIHKTRGAFTGQK